MELALYCPVYGYYEKEEDTIGHTGDYYTSVSVGPLFGELLARQFAAWLEDLPHRGKKLQIVEAGAHRGQLAQDILRWLGANRPRLIERLLYILAEPSARRREWQRQNLLEFAAHVRWVEALPIENGVSGLIFCNELLDAMPVHRVGWEARKRTWFEWGVTMNGGSFVWTKMEPDSVIFDLVRQRFGGSDVLSDWLPDGFVVELCPAAENWWTEAAKALHTGKLLTIDYGLTTEHLLMPERREGTLRAYHRHQSSSDVLSWPGDQDITAHVNFSALQLAGETAGLTTELCTTQSRFLTSIAASLWKSEGSNNWTPAHTRQFQTLTHPDHLGEKFRVLVQSKFCQTGR